MRVSHANKLLSLEPLCPKSNFHVASGQGPSQNLMETLNPMYPFVKHFVRHEQNAATKTPKRVPMMWKAGP